MRRGIAAGILTGTAAAVLGLAAAADAARIKVTTTADDFNNNAADCALREAVQSFNTDSDFGGCLRKGAVEPNTIRLTGGQTYTNTFDGIAENANQAGDLDISTPMAIEIKGSGKATIDGNLIDRAIAVLPGGSLTASKLVITRGSVKPDQPLNDTSGGGIAVAGTTKLDLRNSRLVDNSAPGNQNCACGGAIAASGRVTLQKVDVEGNSSGSIGGAIAKTGTANLNARGLRVYDNETAGFGGGFYLGGSGGVVKIENATVAENNALGFTFGNGGGMHVAGTAVRLTNVTFNRNEANVSGGGINTTGSAVRMNAVTVNDNVANVDANATGHGGGLAGTNFKVRNSIVAGNFDFSATAPENDCNDSFASSHNLFGTGGGCFIGAQNATAADPRLKPLADNGGFSETQALEGGSRAIGLGGKSTPKRDQRGIKRDGDPDAGAYER